ncbi:hypothetical protein JCM10207_005117 [Rhodosporidiobolus poonsookiae]
MGGWDLDIGSAWDSASTSLTASPAQLAQAWSTLRTFLDPLATTPLSTRHSPDLDDAYDLVKRNHQLDDLWNDYLESVRAAFPLVRTDIDALLDRFTAAPDEEARFEAVLALLHCIGSWIQRWQAPVGVVWPSSTTLFLRRHFLPLLYFHLPSTFPAALQSFLLTLLRHSHTPPSQLAAAYPACSLALPTLLTLLDRFDPLLFGLVYDEIERRVESECRGKWGEKKLEGLVGWLKGGAGGKDGEGSIMGWLLGIYSDDASSSASASSAVEGTEKDDRRAASKGKGKEKERDKATDGAGAKDREAEARRFLKPTLSRFEYHVHKMLGQLRTTELYDMILAYPASQPALEDLRACLQKTDQRPLLLARLRTQLHTRLLHPGTDTRDLLTTYVALVRALRVVDPQGVVLARAAGGVRGYLRSRKDTIHHIVTSLLSSTSSLFAELQASTSLSSSSGSGGVDAAKARQLLLAEGKDEAENYSDPKWVPEPVDAPADYRKSRSADILQLLVSIYDTKDVFVKELQVLLAQRLLLIRDYNFEEEIRNIATLKLRFGDAALQGCDVMIGDLASSKALDGAVHDRRRGEVAPAGEGEGEEKEQDIPLHATIVSRLFWPSFQSAPLKLPGQMGRAQQAYDRLFASLKPDKKLRWLPQLGSVNLTVELADGRKVTTDATPVQAGVLELFGTQDTWSTRALAAALRLSDPSLARNALYFWHNLGVVRPLSPSSTSSSTPAAETGAGGEEEMWRLVEHAEQAREGDDAAGGGRAEGFVVEEEGQAVQSVEEERVAQMRVFWQFIQGMLTNLGALPLSRIHSTLNMLAPGYKGKTTDELTALLEALAGEGVVMKTAKGQWKIVK